MPAPYCHPLDVIRRFDPSLTLDDLSNSTISTPSVEQLWARIRSVCQDWDRDTGTALRERREGSPGAPRTYEYHDADRTSGFPLRVELDHDDIVPFDPATGDVLEIRTGRDDWEDITADEGDEWVLLHDSGDLKLYQFLVQRVWWEARDERYLRTTYRYGALGGSRERGGQTTLDAQLDSTSSSVSVADASRLPHDGGVVLITEPSPSSPDSAEYVHVTDVDADADTLTVTRGVNGTDAAAHDSGVLVHYCPEDVRDAVAAQTAAELIRYDQAVQKTDSDNAAISPGQKLDAWEAEFESAKAQYSAVRRM